MKALQTESERRKSRNRLATYRPYTKQREFHAAGKTKRERLFLAGNQLGKTVAGGAEVAMHLTGRYPADWPGRRWDRPTTWWAAGVTGETTRDTVQRILFGRIEQLGTGWIPADCIIDKPSRALGVADLFDTAQIRHISGGISYLALKFYEKGRQKWQAETLDGVWYDEEPPEDIYSEGLTRTNATNGITLMTATPLMGMTEVVRKFYPEPTTADRHLTQMTIDDAEHYTPEQRAKIIASYPPHEREARAKGIPMLGSGRIFPVEESLISIEPFAIPKHWKWLGAMDFGWDHPFAAVKIAYDADHDVIYITQSLRVREQTPQQHAMTLRTWGDWLPWAWPRDGRRETLEGAGVALAKQYRDVGLKMLDEHAQFDDGSVSVEAGLMDMLDRMQTGRLKVFSTLNDWFEEFRVYHREDGKVVKLFDDLMAASRYGIMCKRFSAWNKAKNWQQPAAKWVV